MTLLESTTAAVGANATLRIRTEAILADITAKRDRAYETVTSLSAQFTDAPESISDAAVAQMDSHAGLADQVEHLEKMLASIERASHMLGEIENAARRMML